MITIGITGGIGSGKSTVCKEWEKLGAYIIYADDVAKEIMRHNPSVKKAITESFGEEAYHSDGSLNRVYLAHEAFEKGRVEELNAIVHPHVPREVELLIQNAQKQGVEVVVYEAALLLQNLRPDHLDHIVLVLADEEQRIDWVRKRDDAERQDVMNRIRNQQDFETLKDRADWIIRNDDSLAVLKQRARNLYQQVTGK